LQAAIKTRYGITSTLKEGHSGIFKVDIDGKTVFDNQITHRFPENEEIFDKITALKT
jgi:hypothetical protein